MKRNNDYLIRLLNVVLRAMSMVSRLFLIFGLAYLLTPSELAQYGLLAVTLGFSVLILGGDYYTYSHRELMSTGSDNWCFVFQHHVTALVIFYCLLLPIQALYFYYGLLPWKLCIWFYLLLISEHLAQEVNRLLIVIREPLNASIVLLVRSGVWVWLLIPWMWFELDSRYLENVLLFWLCGSFSAVLLGYFMVYKETQQWYWSEIDWGWLRKGVGVGSLFLVSALSFKALTTIDRYLVEYINGTDMLAVYVLYIGIAMSIYSIIDSAAVSFLYPQIVSAWRTSDYVEFRNKMKELWFYAIGGSVLLAVIIGLTAPWLLMVMGKTLYLENIWLLLVLLMASVVYSIGLVPHYGLYAKGGDKQIMLIHLSSLLVLTMTVGLVGIVWVEGSVAIGLLIAFCWIGVAKYKFSKSIYPTSELAFRS